MTVTRVVASAGAETGEYARWAAADAPDAARGGDGRTHGEPAGGEGECAVEFSGALPPQTAPPYPLCFVPAQNDVYCARQSI